MSATPSIASFDSYASGQGTRDFNPDTERFRTLYRLSQEDLHLQRQQHEAQLAQIQARHAEREQQLLDLANSERDYYQGLLRAQGEQERRGEGSSSKGRGPSGFSGGSRRG